MPPGVLPDGPAAGSARPHQGAAPSGPVAGGQEVNVEKPYWAELLDLTGGDGVLASALEDSLYRLAGGRAGQLLAELADDVLHGRVRLRAAASSAVYGGALGEALHRFQRWYDRLDPGQRAALTAGADLAMRHRGSVGDNGM